MTKKLYSLLEKEFLLDFRSKYPFLSIIMYLATVAYISNISFQGVINTSTWNSIFWMLLLFTSLVAVGKSFLQEQDRTLYYFFLAPANIVIASKIIYQNLYNMVLVFLTLIIIRVFFPIDIPNFGLFSLNLALASIGLASAFTMISSVTSSASNQGNVMAVLGFPIAIPVLVLAVTNSRKILFGSVMGDIKGGLTTLLSIDVVIIVVIFILFPYSWRK